jgi:glycosyltransferase involved in cell wall biosynthesis
LGKVTESLTQLNMSTEQKRLRIAYYSKNDPLDKRSWSGTTYYFGKTLQKNIGDVDYLGPVHFAPWFDKIIRGMAKFCRVFLGSNYVAKYSLLQNWYCVKQLQRKMKGKRYDVIIAPSASPELGLLKTSIPVIYMSDATYRLYSAYYKKEFDRLDRSSRWEGEYLEKQCMKKSKLFLFTSEWAAASAIKDYGVDPSKIEVIPLGANIDFTPDRSVIFEKEKNNTLTLLYLAVDWERKGGDIAFEALEHLHRKGIKAKLIVCGCMPPAEYKHQYMEVIPFLNKNIKEDHEQFVKLLSSVHFLILPTRADCSSLVACEANAYGVPSITTKTGGVPAIVKDGVNGYCLPLGARGDAYASLIASIYQDEERYHQLIRSSRDRFEQVLNWDAYAEAFKKAYAKHFGVQLQEKRTAGEMIS